MFIAMYLALFIAQYLGMPDASYVKLKILKTAQTTNTIQLMQ